MKTINSVTHTIPFCLVITLNSSQCNALHRSQFADFSCWAQFHLLPSLAVMLPINIAITYTLNNSSNPFIFLFLS